MKKLFVILVLVLVNFCAVSFNACAKPADSAAAAIVYEPETATVLYEHCKDTRMQIASTTKILTALVVLENCDCLEIVDILPEYTGIEGSSIYLAAGEKLTVKELLYGMMLESGNDAAVALACHTAGSIGAFADLMNETAEGLGCKNSHFANPHGLDAAGHYATAFDLALIAAAAMDNETLREITSTKSIAVAGRSFVNHNKLLWSCDDIVGIKTGYTLSSGRSLVSCAERGGMRLICVTLNDRDDWDDHVSLYDWAFSQFKLVDIGDSYDIPVISGVCGTVAAEPEHDFRRLISAGGVVEIKVFLPRFLYAPVFKDSGVGRIVVLINGETAENIPLVAGEDADLDKRVPLTRWEKIKWAWYFANRYRTSVPPPY